MTAKIDIKTLPTGTIIRDIEDGYCYYEGIVTTGGKYRITNAIWCGQPDPNMIGVETEPSWWYIKVL